MKKEDIEKGIELFIETLKNTKIKIDYKEDVCYMRKLDGRFMDSTNQAKNLLGYVLITEDPEKLALLEKMVNKGAQKRNIKLEDLGEIS
ncbi:MAG: hypothetical protein HWN67_05330 [Candidatus Helarchaeota archaeon]|nr:hypothetical protein [Candidatus Helarchaeota archaeon]